MIKLIGRATVKNNVTLALVFLAHVSSATGQTSLPPRYDPEGWCKRVSEVTGGSEWLKSACLEQEQTAYDRLKPDWNSVPAKTRGYCDQVARSSGRGSYALLEQCIDMEYRSRLQNDNTRFRF
jgi:hypothetical protein